MTTDGWEFTTNETKDRYKDSCFSTITKNRSENYAAEV
jgi:hypothetical protein